MLAIRIMGWCARSSRAVGLAALVLLGCSPKHPPYIDGAVPNTHGSQGGASDDSSATPGDGGSASPSTAGKHPGGVSVGPSGALDQSEVYLWGTLSPGASYTDAIARVADPNTYSVGWGDYGDARSATFIGNDLIYSTTGDAVVRQYVPDGVWNADLKDIDYPKDPQDNDPEIATPMCMGQVGGLRGVLVSPGGRLIYLCSSETGDTWYEGTAPIYTDGKRLLALNDDNLALAYDGTFEVVDLSAPDAPHEIAEITGADVAFRVHDGGFSVVENSTPLVLWHVAADGSAEKAGEYPAEPDGSTAYGWSSDTRASVLGPDDSLYQFANPSEVGGTLIIRRSVDGSSAVVYDEADDPHVKIHISALVTGPVIVGGRAACTSVV
jgi:hypothetical protein